MALHNANFVKLSSVRTLGSAQLNVTLRINLQTTLNFENVSPYKKDDTKVKTLNDKLLKWIIFFDIFGFLILQKMFFNKYFQFC